MLESKFLSWRPTSSPRKMLATDVPSLALGYPVQRRGSVDETQLDLQNACGCSAVVRFGSADARAGRFGRGQTQGQDQGCPYLPRTREAHERDGPRQD